MRAARARYDREMCYYRMAGCQWPVAGGRWPVAGCPWSVVEMLGHGDERCR